MKHLKGIRFYKNDLPSELLTDEVLSKPVAIDTETTGLSHVHHRLCLVQLCWGDGVCHLVQIDRKLQPAPNLIKLLRQDSDKLFHFARFDVARLYQTFGVLPLGFIYCTKIASRIARTSTDRHSLGELTRSLLGIDISKAEQSSYWGAEVLTDSQKSYAAADVLYLHQIRDKLNQMMEREGLYDLFKVTCDFIRGRVLLDAAGYQIDIFAHHIPRSFG